MRHGRGARGRGRGMGRGRGGAGQVRGRRTRPMVTSWIASMLPALRDALVPRSGNSGMNQRRDVYPKLGQSASEQRREPAETVTNNRNRHDIFITKGAGKLKAQVDRDICSGCGACEAECPAGAIKVEDVAIIDESLCTGCGACVEVCPLEALSMK